jgi:ASC-1-like (ASCH) protein
MTKREASKLKKGDMLFVILLDYLEDSNAKRIRFGDILKFNKKEQKVSKDDIIVYGFKSELFPEEVEKLSKIISNKKLVFSHL